MRCRRCQKLVVEDEKFAANILEERLHITTFDVPEQGVVRVFERLEDTVKTNRVLAEAGVGIRESYLTGQDLEGYFMDLLGGGANV